MENAITGLMLILAVGLGFGLHWGWLRFRAEEKQRIPSRWLLNARGLVTTEELEVWKWLRQAFADHVVMVKVPVMRFTVPSTRDQAQNKKQNWHELLNGVYCTFTVSNLDGKVVGCVDVPGKRGLTRAQREMKEGLLQECGIGYTTVRGGSLPAGSAMRTAFLGEPAVVENDAEETRGGDSSFHAALNEFTSEKVKAAKEAAIRELRAKEAPDAESRTKTRDVGFNPDGTGSFMTREKSRYPVQFEDSFTMGNDSRPAKLS
ncbi:MAG TPA: DUF2726 domain-containing protein [Polaromonas sp.]|uniref:DUF2726 domain-containing protein n=1 Tax=Polaromonas sp. TaxID=1869339 RepID=UPI002D5292C6|nr:DUF2726 domain-containing protein [Polaromonas sp.]HYW58780.1 DUF2726 domain-containing protein [Polaromonas sp.]